MAKTVKKTKTPAKPSLKIGEWLHTHARARGIDPAVIHDLRTKVKKSASDKSATEVLGKTDIGKTLLARYALFAKRGSQAGTRSRAKAA
jgi:hypothetical protein